MRGSGAGDKCNLESEENYGWSKKWLPRRPGPGPARTPKPAATGSRRWDR